MVAVIVTLPTPNIVIKPDKLLMLAIVVSLDAYDNVPLPLIIVGGVIIKGTLDHDLLLIVKFDKLLDNLEIVNVEDIDDDV